MVQGIIPFAHHTLSRKVTGGDYVIDATCGNGNDTLFLSELVGEAGHVYAFDIQKQAIDTSKNLLHKHRRENVTFIHDSHALIDQYIDDETSIQAVIFNLGYLPRSDKTIITKPESTIAAVEKSLTLLNKYGVVILVIYAGHDGGAAEKEAVLTFATNLDQQKYTVLKYQFINMKNNPPFTIVIEKI